MTIDEEIQQIIAQIEDKTNGSPCSIRTCNEDIAAARAEIARLKQLQFLDDGLFYEEDVYVKILADDTPMLATKNSAIIKAMGLSGVRTIVDTPNNLVYKTTGTEITIQELVENPELDSLVLFIQGNNLKVTADYELAVVAQMRGQSIQLSGIIDSRQRDTAILAG
jgi:hypothetical protein